MRIPPFTISKRDVYNEVAMTTSYTGMKMDDARAYERIFTTDDDQQQLERFWQEAQAELCQQLISVLADEDLRGDEYRVVLDVSAFFDTTLFKSMALSLRNYFVQAITAKWYTVANKPESAEYAAYAAALLDDVKRKAFFKRAPSRPTYND